MNEHPPTSLTDRLVLEAQAFPWKPALLRMTADLLLLNGSLFLALAAWYFFYTVIVGVSDPALMARTYLGYFINYWAIWSAIALLVFYLHGFYTRARGYASRYKALVILRAVCLAFVLFEFFDYMVFRGSLMPRGVLLIAWGLTLLTVAGVRITKDSLLQHYRLVPKVRSTKVSRVLVIGGAGYLGSVLVKQLLLRGYNVRVLDALFFGDKGLEPFSRNSNFELLAGDIRDISAVVQAMNDCDAIVHLAGIVGDPACEENPKLAIEINRAATRMLVEVSRGHGIARFVFASSCSVYGASPLLADEHSTLAPLSTYAQTKIDSEQIILDARTAGFHPTIFRFATLCGLSRRMRLDLVVNLLVARAAAYGKITIFNGEQWRPFLHVEDTARAIVACLGANPNIVSGEIFNVGDSRMNHRLSELGERIQEIVPGAQVEHVDNSDRRNYRVSFDKIRARLGFHCSMDLDQTIREIYQWTQSGETFDLTAREFNNLMMLRGSEEAWGQGKDFSHSVLDLLSRQD